MLKIVIRAITTAILAASLMIGGIAVVAQTNNPATRAWVISGFCALVGCTMNGDLLFTDATYDIGKSGATRPRNIFASGTGAFGGAVSSAGFSSNGNNFQGYGIQFNDGGGNKGLFRSGGIDGEAWFVLQNGTTLGRYNKAYTVGTLPAAIAGARAHVTDQLTSCPANGAALTAGGAVTCPVFYNGVAWVGG